MHNICIFLSLNFCLLYIEGLCLKLFEVKVVQLSGLVEVEEKLRMMTRRPQQAEEGTK